MLRSESVMRCGVEMTFNCLSNVLDHFLHGLALTITARKRRNFSPKTAFFGRMNDDIDFHLLHLTIQITSNHIDFMDGDPDIQLLETFLPDFLMDFEESKGCAISCVHPN